MLREQDRFLPIANIAKIMKKAIPNSSQGKIAKDARECVQECVSEFISFITRYAKVLTNSAVKLQLTNSAVSLKIPKFQRGQRAMCEREKKNHEWGRHPLGDAESRLRQLHRTAESFPAEVPRVVEAELVGG